MVGQSPCVEQDWISGLLTIHLPLYPKLRIRLRSQFPIQLVRSVLSGELNLALVAAPPEDSQITAVSLSRAQLYALLPDGHAAADKESLVLQDLAQDEWILFSKQVHPLLHDAIFEAAQREAIVPKDVQAESTRSGIISRIVLGGTYGPTEKVAEDGARTQRWYSGRIPGLLEEVWLSAKAGQPVFLLGAFGGAARLVIDLLRGIDREEATWAYQKEAPYSTDMRHLYEDRGLGWIDYPEILKSLRDRGAAGLNPLLEPAENERLFDSVDPLEIVELILLGLSKLKP